MTGDACTECYRSALGIARRLACAPRFIMRHRGARRDQCGDQRRRSN
jgi:hypothetical protein